MVKSALKPLNDSFIRNWNVKVCVFFLDRHLGLDQASMLERLNEIDRREVSLDALAIVAGCKLRLLVEFAFCKNSIDAECEPMLAELLLFPSSYIGDFYVRDKHVRIEYERTGDDSRLGHADPNMNASKGLQWDFTIVWTYYARAGRAFNSVLLMGVGLASQKGGQVM